MTTRAAENLYLAEHLAEWEGHPIAVYNPNNWPLEQLPVIYGFNNGGRKGWMYAALVAQDGTGLGGHICSDEGYMRHDLGIIEGSRPDRHEGFRKHYPDGYRMEFVEGTQVCDRSHAGLNEALRLNQEKAPPEQTE